MREIAGVRFHDRLEEILDPSHTALLVVDMQNDFCSPDGHFARHGRDVGRIDRIVPSIVRLLQAAERAGIFVVFTQQTTLPDMASDPPAWTYFKTRDGKSPDYTIRGTWGAGFIEALQPNAGVIIVEKHRPTAFHETDLDQILRDQAIESVLVVGCITQGCVQATTTDASYHGYYAVVAEDCVESTNAELHENALTFLRSRYDVVPSAEVIDLWARASKHR